LELDLLIDAFSSAVSALYRPFFRFLFNEASELFDESRWLAEEVIGEPASLARPNAREMGEYLF